MTSYFLDTTALIEAEYGADAQRADLRNILRQASARMTSEHVVREWIGFALVPPLALLNALKAHPDESIQGIFAMARQGFQPRVQKAFMATFQKLVDALGGLTRDGFAHHVENIVRTRMQVLARCLGVATVDRLGAVVVRRNACPLARNPLDGDVSLVGLKVDLTCRKPIRKKGRVENEICGRRAVIESELHDYRAVSESLTESDSSAVKRLADYSTRTLKATENGMGKACWGVAGDLNISLDCPSGFSILSSDHSFRHLEGCLDLDVTSFPATPSLK